MDEVLEVKPLVGAAKAAHEKKQVKSKKPGKKPYPFSETGASDNAPIRTIRLVKPECPVDPTPEIRQRDGSYKVNPRYTGEENCQFKYRLNMQGIWDVEQCESLGHDPWHTEFRRRLVDDVIDPETGEVTTQKTKIMVERRLNVVAVSLSERHTSGTELQLAKARGCLTFDEFGERFPDEWYETPCEFRQCSRKVTMTTRYGDFCGERHARLCAGEQKGILRFVPNEADPHRGGQAALGMEYEGRMESINLGAKEKK